MSQDQKTQTDDTDIALLMQYQNQQGLRLLLKVHGPVVRGWLTAKHGEHIADEALILAADKAWRAADAYDESKGPLGPWFLAIAQNAALDIYRREQRHHQRRVAYDPSYEPFDEDPETVDAVVITEREKNAARNERELRGIIAGLPPLQRQIILADLADGDTVDAEALAKRCDSTVNSIHVQRSKARRTIREGVIRRGLFGYGRRVN